MSWFLHYTGSDNTAGEWYGFWSGFGSDLGEVALIGGLVHMARQHNCHVDGCLSLKTSMDPVVHALACRKHHSHGHLQGTAPTQPEVAR